MQRSWAIVATVFLGILILFFQNCSKQEFSGLDSQNSSSFDNPTQEQGPNDQLRDDLDQGINPPSEPEEVVQGPFEWKSSTFGRCDVLCGDGLRRRVNTCFDNGLNKIVSNSNCSDQPEPSKTMACSIPNPSCTDWVSTKAELKNIGNLGDYVCLQKHIDFEREDVQYLSQRFSNKTLNGCGHRISGLSFKNEGLFKNIAHSEISNLILYHPSIQAKDEDSQTAFRFGTLAGVASGNSNVHNVELVLNEPASIEGAGPATYCGGLIGTISGGHYKNLKITGSEIHSKCSFFGGLIGYVHGFSGDIELDDIQISSKFKMNGSGYIRSSGTENGQYFGGLVGYYQTHPNNPQDSIRNIEVTGDIELHGPFQIAGGIIGTIYNNREDKAPLLVNNLRYIGNISAENLYCENKNPTLSGVIGHSHMLHQNNHPIDLNDLSFTGKILIEECSPSASHASRRDGKAISAALGFVRKSGAGPNPVLNRFNHIGDIEIRTETEGSSSYQNESGILNWKLD